jgi:hypothetical protein
MWIFGSREQGWTINSEGGSRSAIREGKKNVIVRTLRKIFRRGSK